MENISQMSLLEVAIKLMEQKRGVQNIRSLITEVLEMKGLNDEDGSLAVQLYIDITTSSKFVYMGNEEWDLKIRQSLDEYDKDGSAFNSKEDLEEFEEEEEIDDIDEDDLLSDDLDYDDEDDEDSEDSDDDEDSDDEDDYDDYDDSDYDDEDDLDDGEDLERYSEEGFNEDQYNDYMDDYEDMYDEN